MFKIAILGCENSHAKHFTDLIAKGAYPDMEVVGVYSEKYSAAEALNREFGVPIMQDYAELAGRVDGVMITARHGDNHYRYAKPYLDDGIPFFIDKPITCNEAEAVEFMQVAKKKGLRLCGGSTCAALKETLELADDVQHGTLGEVRGGWVEAPIHMDSPYGGFYFYAQHLVEIMTTIFGNDMKRVRAHRDEKSVSFTACYDGFHVTGTYLESVPYYTAAVYGSEGARLETLTFSPDNYRHEVNDMHDLLVGKDMKKSYSDFIKPVFIFNAILRSMESSDWESVADVQI